MLQNWEKADDWNLRRYSLPFLPVFPNEMVSSLVDVTRHTNVLWALFLRVELGPAACLRHHPQPEQLIKTTLLIVGELKVKEGILEAEWRYCGWQFEGLAGLGRGLARGHEFKHLFDCWITRSVGNYHFVKVNQHEVFWYVPGIVRNAIIFTCLCYDK